MNPGRKLLVPVHFVRRLLAWIVGTLFPSIVPPADKPIAAWHVSPLVDLCAYHFSWAFILIPLALAGERHPEDYLVLWCLGLTLSFLHRQYTMPYVYLDKHVFSQHVTRFTLFFYLLMLGFVATAFVMKWKAPAQFFLPIDVALVVGGLALAAQAVVMDRAGHKLSVNAMVWIALPYTIAVIAGLNGAFLEHHVLTNGVVLALFAVASIIAAFDERKEVMRRLRFTIVIVVVMVVGLIAPLLSTGDVALNDGVVKGSALIGVIGGISASWNIWHTLMQKFGIMRLYASKSTVPVERRTPAWVDRLFVFCWIPFLVLWLGPAQRDTIKKFYRSVTQHLTGFIDVLEIVQPFLLPPAILLIVFATGAFFYYEWRADRLRSWPRITMVVALTLLNASFLVASPLKVYIAYGFSHAIEYMVFVWAFLRRRYAQPHEHRPLLQRALKRPWLAYGVFTLSIGIAFFWIDFARKFGFHDGVGTIFDLKVNTWLFSFAIWHSFAHFYFDGFLWKMRAPQVRASI